MLPIVIRPTAYMETWAGIVGGPILATGRARVFGRGRNPINFVSAGDVAAVVEALAVATGDEPSAGRTIEVVGPEDLSFDDLVEGSPPPSAAPSRSATCPLPMLRAMAIALRPIKPILAAQVAAAVVLDTTVRTAADSRPDSATVRHGTTRFATVIDGWSRPRLQPRGSPHGPEPGCRGLIRTRIPDTPGPIATDDRRDDRRRSPPSSSSTTTRRRSARPAAPCAR